MCLSQLELPVLFDNPSVHWFIVEQRRGARCSPQLKEDLPKDRRAEGIVEIDDARTGFEDVARGIGPFESHLASADAFFHALKVLLRGLNKLSRKLNSNDVIKRMKARLTDDPSFTAAEIDEIRDPCFDVHRHHHFGLDMFRRGLVALRAFGATRQREAGQSFRPSATNP